MQLLLLMFFLCCKRYERLSFDVGYGLFPIDENVRCLCDRQFWPNHAYRKMKNFIPHIDPDWGFCPSCVRERVRQHVRTKCAKHGRIHLNSNPSFNASKLFLMTDPRDSGTPIVSMRPELELVGPWASECPWQIRFNLRIRLVFGWNSYSEHPSILHTVVSRIN